MSCPAEWDLENRVNDQYEIVKLLPLVYEAVSEMGGARPVGVIRDGEVSVWRLLRRGSGGVVMRDIVTLRNVGEKEYGGVLSTVNAFETMIAEGLQTCVTAS